MEKQRGTLQTRLSQFLFKYRTTPHTTTGISPIELRWGTKLRSHMTLLQPDVGKTVRYAQHKQKRKCDQHVRPHGWRCFREKLLKPEITMAGWKSR